MRIVFLSFLSLLLFSCTDNNSDETIGTTDSTTSIQPGIDSSALTDLVNGPIWSVDYDTVKKDFVLKQNREVNADTLRPEKLIEQINEASTTQLVFRRISHDTIYVAIPDSEYLTQRIGTTGAKLYMSTTTFSLTELKGIKYVNYDFTDGDHLSAGTMTREDFKDFQN